MNTGWNGHDGGELVRLTTVGDNIEASALRSLLEANDIACVIQGEQHRSMLGVMGAYIELNVLVSAIDLDRAQQVLAEREADTATTPIGEVQDDAPRSRRRLKLIALFILFLMFGGPALVALVVNLLVR